MAIIVNSNDTAALRTGLEAAADFSTLLFSLPGADALPCGAGLHVARVCQPVGRHYSCLHLLPAWPLSVLPLRALAPAAPAVTPEDAYSRGEPQAAHDKNELDWLYPQDGCCTGGKVRGQRITTGCRCQLASPAAAPSDTTERRRCRTAT